MSKRWIVLAGLLAAGCGKTPEPEPVSKTPFFDRIVEAKLEAYRTYNRVDTKNDPWSVLMQHALARHPLPDEPADREALLNTLDEELIRFALTRFDAAKQRALEAGRSIINESDFTASPTYPNTVNDFEDLTFFAHLAPDARLVLDAYDLDALRDLGVHWRIIQRARNGFPGRFTLEPDPFAAEYYAEEVSQYAVLLLRVMGLEALAAGEPVLTPAVMISAKAELDRRQSAPAAPVVTRPVVSAARSGPLPAGAPWFTDVTEAAGLAHRHRYAPWMKQYQIDSLPRRRQAALFIQGAGAAAGDLNDDGWTDLLLLSGSGHSLYLGGPDARFTRHAAGETLQLRRPDGRFGEPRQPLIADFDNDGLQDVFITYAKDDHQLFRQTGPMTFQNMTETAGGFGGAEGSGAIAMTFDYDNDGLLDLYLGGYGNYVDGERPVIGRVYQETPAAGNRLFRNRGDFRFEEVTETTRTGDRGWALGLS
ncbi:MAG: VCBS repeat-containing protein, partial [Verrucomicrobiota bacterium]